MMHIPKPNKCKWSKYSVCYVCAYHIPFHAHAVGSWTATWHSAPFSASTHIL